MTTPMQVDIKDDTLIPSEDKPTEDKRKAIRFGILGCTETAIKIAHAIVSLGRSKAIIVAVGSQISYDDAIQFFSGTGFTGYTTAFASYDAVINRPDVDAVFVSLSSQPTNTSVAIDAAKKGKHVLLETPTARNLKELFDVMKACIDNRVQFMDSTMWLHDSRTKEMRTIIRDNTLFGQVKMVHSICTSKENYDVVQDGILHPLGVLSHSGWYCISVILWANSYELPETVTALYATKDPSGILLSCGALLLWPDRGTSATLHCSYVADLTRQTTVIGKNGTLEISVEPYAEGTASFQRASDANFTHLSRRNGTIIPSPDGEITDPKEVQMVRKFVRLVRSIKEQGSEPVKKWRNISIKIQLIIHLIMKSVDRDLQFY